jgi:hypothetical protein
VKVAANASMCNSIRVAGVEIPAGNSEIQVKRVDSMVLQEVGSHSLVKTEMASRARDTAVAIAVSGR